MTNAGQSCPLGSRPAPPAATHSRGSHHCSVPHSPQLQRGVNRCFLGGGAIAGEAVRPGCATEPHRSQLAGSAWWCGLRCGRAHGAPGPQEADTDPGPWPETGWRPGCLGGRLAGMDGKPGRTAGARLSPRGSCRFGSEAVFVKPRPRTSDEARTGPSRVAAGAPTQEARAEVFPGTAPRPSAEAVPSCHSPKNSTQ